ARVRPARAELHLLRGPLPGHAALSFAGLDSRAVAVAERVAPRFYELHAGDPAAPRDRRGLRFRLSEDPWHRVRDENAARETGGRPAALPRPWVRHPRPHRPDGLTTHDDVA